MSATLQVAEKVKGVAPEEFAPFANDQQDLTSEKLIATTRTKLCHAGGRVLCQAFADDGKRAFFAMSRWGQIRQFAPLDESQVTLDGRRA